MNEMRVSGEFVLLYLSFLAISFVVATWKAWRGSNGRTTWVVAALLLWAGLAMALIGAQGGLLRLRAVGAMLMQFGIFVVCVRTAYGVFLRARNVRKTKGR